MPEFAALVVELPADFLADAPPLVRGGKHLGRIEDLLGDRQMLRDARRTRLLAALPAGITPYLFAQRYGVCQSTVASAVFLSTLVSVATLSALLFVLRA